MTRSLFKSACLFLALSAVPSTFAAPVVFDSSWIDAEHEMIGRWSTDAPPPVAAEPLTPEPVAIADPTEIPTTPTPAPTSLATLALTAGYCVVRRRS
ncbi:MAG: hypothetical protein ACIAQF_07765 [Phycisphaerales bacterium JB065]